jgi:hypothetical protein
MTKEQFRTLSTDNIVQPIYPKYSDQGFRILTIDHREDLIEIDEKTMWSNTRWYRYENLDIVVYSKVIDNTTFEEVKNYEKI